MHRQESDNLQILLAAEGQLLDLISEGAPLEHVLNRVCTALDVQVGNIVSLVLFPDDEEHTLHTIARSAATLNLTVFSCTAILSPTQEFLGTLEIYCCFPRMPTLGERGLIDRAAQLASLAIQSYKHDTDTDGWPLDWTAAARRSPCEGPPSNN